MKKLELIENSELEIAERKLSYFFGGDNGWLKKNKLGSYVHWLKEEDEPNVNRLILQASADDLKSIKDHVRNRLDYLRRKLDESKKSVSDYEKEIELAKQHLEIVSKQNTFRDAIIALI